MRRMLGPRANVASGRSLVAKRAASVIASGLSWSDDRCQPPCDSLPGYLLARQIVPILALLLSTAFLLAGNGLHSLLLPLRGAAEGFATNELGLIGTGWASGFVLGCLSAPRVVKRVGHIRAFSCSAA